MAFATPPDINKPNQRTNSQSDEEWLNADVITTAQIKRTLRYPLDVGVTAGLDSYIEFRLVEEETLDIGNVVATIINSAVAVKDRVVKLGGDVAAGVALGASQEDVDRARTGITDEAVRVASGTLNVGLDVVSTMIEGYQDGTRAEFLADSEVYYQEPSTQESRVVKLYMPPSFSYSDGVNYDNVELGVGGAMDLASGAKRLIITMTHTNKDGSSKVKPVCSLPLTALGTVNMVITDLAVFEFIEGKLTLTEVMPGSSLDEIKEKTEASFEINLS